MSDILIKPPQIRSTAVQLREHAKVIQSSLEDIEQIFSELPPDRFAGLSSGTIRNRYGQKRQYLQAVQQKTLYFAENLEKIADKFEQADNALNKSQPVGQVLGTSIGVVAEGADWKLSEGSYARRISDQINSQYSGQINSLQKDLEHFKKSKELFEASRQSDLNFLKELDEAILDYKNHDNIFDFFKDKFGELLGLPDTYEEIRQRTLARLTDTEGKIADLEGKITTTEAQIQSVSDDRDAAIKDELENPNTTYVVAPSNPNLTAKKGWCMAYVSDFRGQPPTPGGIPRAGSAADLVTNEKYADLRYQVPPSTSDLRDQVVPGTVVAWNKGQQGADTTHGHAAVITEVGKDYVVVKESSWGNAVGAERTIPLNKLSELTLIGYSEIPRL